MTAVASSGILAYRTPPGVGGLGHHAAHVLSALSGLIPELHVCGPRDGDGSRDTHTLPPEPLVAAWRRRYTWLRYMTGRYQLAIDRRFGRWLASELSTRAFERGYFFTQIARESLALARDKGALTILDSPNGHIRDFREQLCRESLRWTGWPYLGHPNEAMVQRVEEEYQLADRIRVSSEWARRSLIEGGVAKRKVFVVPQSIDVSRFAPSTIGAATGPLRVVFVGSISLGKGFQYLLRAMSRLGGHHFALTMIGATGDPWSHRLLRRLRAGLEVVHAAGDPLSAYQRGELFVLPTLHDGFGLVVAEAMACGLPVITTEACGAAEWIDEGSGWVVPRGDEDALADALERAASGRRALRDMGRHARRAAQHFSGDTITAAFQRSVSRAWAA
jgi:glycosyltransferase involved in cell wall biosynthesis